MMSKSRQHEFGQALYDIIYHALLGQGVDKIQATAKAARRNRQIYDEFTGDNHEVLAKKYGVTLKRIYAIIKEQRQFEFNTRQFYLWDD